MRYEARIECEFKLRREYGHNFRPASAALTDLVNFRQVGEPEYFVQCYFDLDAALSAADAMFRIRRISRGVRYILKRPIENRSGLLVRREHILDSAEPLDLANPFQRRISFVSELLAIIAPSADSETPERLRRFKAQVILRNQRVPYIIYDFARDIDYALFLCVDQVECFDPNGRETAPFARFSELEIEIIRHHPGAYDWLAACRDRLALEGYIAANNSKYAHATTLQNYQIII